MRSQLTALALLVALSAPAAAQADAYYVVVFGAQHVGLKDPKTAHSFATFVHVACDGTTEAITISWLPVTGKVRPWAVHPEPGRNYGLEETLQLSKEHGTEVAMWGPYEITRDLWERALWQKGRLDSGEVLYKANDLGATDGRVTNCLHAISYMAREPGQKAPRIIVAAGNWGESGSYWIALRLRPWFVCPCQTHPWIMERLGLNPDCFVVNDLARNPTRNPVIRVTQAVLQAYLLPNRVKCGPP